MFKSRLTAVLKNEKLLVLNRVTGEPIKLCIELLNIFYINNTLL